MIGVWSIWRFLSGSAGETQLLGIWDFFFFEVWIFGFGLKLKSITRFDPI